jgi:hypothetical protein
MQRLAERPKKSEPQSLACASVLSPERRSPSTSRLPGQAGTPRTHVYSWVLPEQPSPCRTDSSNTAVLPGTQTTGFLDRVHKFDSCRGHAPRGLSPNGLAAHQLTPARVAIAAPSTGCLPATTRALHLRCLDSRVEHVGRSVGELMVERRCKIKLHELRFHGRAIVATHLSFARTASRVCIHRGEPQAARMRPPRDLCRPRAGSSSAPQSAHPAAKGLTYSPQLGHLVGLLISQV